MIDRGFKSEHPGPGLAVKDPGDYAWIRVSGEPSKPGAGPSRTQSVSISGRVHAPGSRNFGQVELQDANRRRLRMSSVGADGRYQFRDLKPGTYHVKLHRAPDEFYRTVEPSERVVRATGHSVLNVDFRLR